MPDVAIFAVTNRTGSTLLQRILNADPDTLIWGENGRVLMRLLDVRDDALVFSSFMASVRETYIHGERPIDVDVSCMSPEEGVVRSATLEAARAFLSAMYPRADGKRVGFKEVGHRPSAVDLFCQAFPEAVVLFLARDPVAAWRSHPSAWPVTLDEFIEDWRTNVIGYQERGPLLWFEDLVSDPATQAEICRIARIGAAEFHRVLEVKVSSTAGDSRRPQEDFDRIMDECRDLLPARLSHRWANSGV